jgi:hypothetical protein
MKYHNRHFNSVFNTSNISPLHTHILTSPTKLGCISPTNPRCISPSSGGVSGAPPLPPILSLVLRHTLPFLPPNSSTLILFVPRSNSSLNVPTSSSFSFHILSTACLSFSMRRSSSTFSLRIRASTASRPAFAAASSWHDVPVEQPIAPRMSPLLVRMGTPPPSVQKRPEMVLLMPEVALPGQGFSWSGGRLVDVGVSGGE